MTNKPDKGKKDGSCNVTACQAPMAGTMQGWMVNHTVTNGRLYYCERCSRRFNEYDDSIREPRRITWDETTGPRVAGIHEDHPVHLTVMDVTLPITEREARLQEIYGKPPPITVYVDDPGRSGIRDIVLDMEHAMLPRGRASEFPPIHVQRPDRKSKQKSASLSKLLRK